MTSTFHSIETARRSLFTQTAALNTTGHNIANANTEGYTRQRVNMQASLPIEAYGLLKSTVESNGYRGGILIYRSDSRNVSG